jgi:hypothetical protein
MVQRQIRMFWLFIPVGKAAVRVPPLFFGTTTVSRLRALWAGQSRSRSAGRKRASILQDGVLTGTSCRNGDVRGSYRQQGLAGV